MFAGEPSSSGNPLSPTYQSTSLYEDEEHPWGAPPPPPSNSNAFAGSSSSTAAPIVETPVEERSTSYYDDPSAAGFAADPFVESPFARQPSYSGGAFGRGGGGGGDGYRNGSMNSSGSTDSQRDRNGFRRDDEVQGTASRIGSGAGAGTAWEDTASTPAPPAPDKGSAAGAPPTSATASSGFAPRPFQSHNPSSVMGTQSSSAMFGGGGGSGVGQGQAPAQIAPGYPMPQSYASAYSPFARVESLNTRKENAEEMYGVPENFLEVEVRNAMTHGEYPARSDRRFTSSC